MIGEPADILVDEPSPDPTEPPDDPTDDPTDEPTPDPTDPPVEPTEEPTDEPTEDPTDEPTVPPTEEPTVPPTETPSEGPVAPPTVITPIDPALPSRPVQPDFPEQALPAPGPISGAPSFAPIAPLTVASRSDLTDDDLMAGIRVFDDIDTRLVPMISSWGDWHSETECPNGYPCRYRIVYLVFDSDDNFAEATRDIIVTGRSTSPTVGAVSALGLPAIESATVDELPWTGVDTEYLLLGSGGLIAAGFVLLRAARRPAFR